MTNQEAIEYIKSSGLRVCQIAAFIWGARLADGDTDSEYLQFFQNLIGRPLFPEHLALVAEQEGKWTFLVDQLNHIWIHHTEVATERWPEVAALWESRKALNHYATAGAEIEFLQAQIYRGMLHRRGTGCGPA